MHKHRKWVEIPIIVFCISINFSSTILSTEAESSISFYICQLVESTESKENQLLPIYIHLKNTTNFQNATFSNTTFYILKSQTI